MKTTSGFLGVLQEGGAGPEHEQGQEFINKFLEQIFAFPTALVAKSAFVTVKSFASIMEISEEGALQTLQKEGIPLDKPGWWEVSFTFRGDLK